METDCVFIEKKSVYQWTFAVQIHIVQWTTVLESWVQNRSVGPRNVQQALPFSVTCKFVGWFALFLHGNCEAILRHTENSTMGSKTWSDLCTKPALFKVTGDLHGCRSHVAFTNGSSEA